MKADKKEIKTPHYDALDETLKRFVLSYLTHGNATRAYKDSGLEGKSAPQLGHLLLKKLDVLEAITEMAPVVGVSPAEVAAVISEMIRADPADLAPVLQGMTLDEARKQGVPTHLIRRIKVSRRVVGKGDEAEPYEDVTLELHDRQKALELMTRILGLIVEKREERHVYDVRVNWPDLAKSGPSMAEKRAAAVDEALRKAGRK